MSGLSQEQLERIRENKRKAQERLARKRPLPQASSADLPSLKQPSIKPPSIKPSFYSSAAPRPPVKKPPLVPEDKVLFKKRITASFITASFILKDASHFKVLVPYEPTLIDLFKTIKSRSYGKCGLNFYKFLITVFFFRCQYASMELFITRLSEIKWVMG